MDHDHDKDTAAPLKDAASKAGSVAADIREAAAQKYDETVTEARAQANKAKDDVAGEVDSVAHALRRAAEDLRSGSPQERTLGMIANGLADASDAMRDKDLGEMIDGVSRVARNNPALFLGGALLLGFAGSRYAKASAERRGQDHGPARGQSHGASSDAATGASFAGETARRPGPPQEDIYR